jgi:hypothetical protein
MTSTFGLNPEIINRVVNKMMQVQTGTLMNAINAGQFNQLYTQLLGTTTVQQPASLALNGNLEQALLLYVLQSILTVNAFDKKMIERLEGLGVSQTVILEFLLCNTWADLQDLLAANNLSQTAVASEINNLKRLSALEKMVYAFN